MAGRNFSVKTGTTRKSSAPASTTVPQAMTSTAWRRLFASTKARTSSLSRPSTALSAAMRGNSTSLRAWGSSHMTVVTATATESWPTAAAPTAAERMKRSRRKFRNCSALAA